MGKFILLAVLLTLSAFLIPQTQDRAQEIARPLLNPFYRWNSRAEMKQIVADLNKVEEMLMPFPGGRGEFGRWMVKRYKVPRMTLDGWGNSYSMVSRGRQFIIQSPGPDGVLNTPDDLSITGERVGRRGR